MRLDPHVFPERLVYKPGLDTLQEAVISSHFMHGLCRDARLETYSDEQFRAKCLTIDPDSLDGTLLPALLRASGAFAAERAAAARQRARENFRHYGLDDPRRAGPAEFIAEVMFDRNFRRGSRESCAREVLCEKVRERMAAGAPIAMAIPALPFKISSPLKSRGPLPDLAEVNFILALYEVAATIELLYGQARPELPGPLAKFTVVSDGSRFDRLVEEPDGKARAYRAELVRWIERLGLERYVELVDYRALLRDRLPAGAQEAKRAIRERAVRDYARVMWPLFDPCDMAAAMQAAALADPDPESANPEGRFVSLLKSLVYTINYRALAHFAALPGGRFRALYRELAGHIFEPFAAISPDEPQGAEREVEGRAAVPETPQAKEVLRRAMLREVWGAAIEYVAEIKSDRELESEPIQACLSDHFRWTIHAKPGQLAVRVPTALGMPVQAWAGAAVFKRTRKKKLKLCALPVLALEGAGAIPVALPGSGDGRQPLFYIYPDVAFADLDGFLATVQTQLVRTRAS
jgi:hypothetical protein